MDERDKHEQKLLTAVRVIVENSARGKDFSDALYDFLHATETLNAKDIVKWELLIRNEIGHVLRVRNVITGRFYNKPQRFIVPWIDLFSWDGFRRERVLRVMNGPAPNAFLFSMLLRRLNDWVPQVREAAFETILANGYSTNPQIIANTLFDILPNYSSWGRITQQQRNLILDLSEIPDVLSFLVDRIVGSSTGPLAKTLSQLGRRSSIDQDLRAIARGAVQPSARAWAYKCLLDGEAQWSVGRKWVWTHKRYGEGRHIPDLESRKIEVGADYEDILKGSVNDPSPIVRRIAGTVIIANRESLGAIARKLAVQLSKDEYPSVSERGQFALDRLND